MASKRKPAIEFLDNVRENELFLDHAIIVDSDIEWLQNIELLTLWNVTLPQGFLKKLSSLWWLDIRGGSSSCLDVVTGLHQLRYLHVNQIRDMSDLHQLTTLDSLEYLSLYGLPQVSKLPSFRSMHALKRLELGMLKGLNGIENALDAPLLEELLLSKTIAVTSSDVEKINSHSHLKRFFWYAVDVPIRVSKPVIDSIDLPLAESIQARKWFKNKEGA